MFLPFTVGCSVEKSVLLIHSTPIYEHVEWKQMHNIFWMECCALHFPLTSAKKQGRTKFKKKKPPLNIHLSLYSKIFFNCTKPSLCDHWINFIKYFECCERYSKLFSIGSSAWTMHCSRTYVIQSSPRLPCLHPSRRPFKSFIDWKAFCHSIAYRIHMQPNYQAKFSNVKAVTIFKIDGWTCTNDIWKFSWKIFN